MVVSNKKRGWIHEKDSSEGEEEEERLEVMEPGPTASCTDVGPTPTAIVVCIFDTAE